MNPNVRRDLFTSLVGTVPLADVLADLPLPTPLPTPMESMVVLGTGKISRESEKLLNSTNANLCSQITEALLAVDTSFLDLKESYQRVPYTPTAKDPPLIRAVMGSLMTKPEVKLKKLDPSQHPPFSSGSAMVLAPNEGDALVPVRSVPTPPPSKKSKEKKKPPPISLDDAPSVPNMTTSTTTTKQKKRHRRISSSSDEATPPPPKKKKSKKSQSQQQQQQVPSLTAESLCAASFEHQITEKPSKQKLKKKQEVGQRKKPRVPISEHPPLPLPSPSLPIQFSRAKLTGCFGLPYSGALHQGEAGGIVPPQQQAGGMVVGVAYERWAGQDMSFDMAPGVSDRKDTEAERVHKKKKKKHSHHHRGDQVKMANLQRFTAMVSGLFDQQMSDDDLFNRSTVSEVVSQVTNLKLQGILHQVPVESLMQLIGLMDKHVLDSANLLINAVPEGMDSDAKVWRELARDRITRSADSALVILHIITAPNMPKKVYLEESVDQVLALTKFHLDNNVYPQFDPVYKAENKESGMLPRQKRRGGGGGSGQAANKVTNAVYHKLTEVVEAMAVLTETQPLTDTTVLLLSSMGTLPFFVENVSLLQLSALRLVRGIFTRYEKHRDLILEEIFASLQRLPTNKRNLRSYKLSNGQHIQMLTALVLQLIQCIVVPPKPTKEDKKEKSSTPVEPAKDELEKKGDMIDVQMTNSYSMALATGKNFLAKFLKKCSGGKDEDDFRPLFDNFIQDLLTTLNLPMWPASEALLTLLGMLLVQSFSSRSTEQSLRLMSLDHLGVIAARLRKDETAPASENENEELIDVLAQVMQSKLDRGTPSPTVLTRMDAQSENTQHYQKVLIAFLNKQSTSDPACAYARDFYIGQWLYDNHLELDRILKENSSLNLDALNDNVNGEMSSSSFALQQSEQKKDTLLSFLDSKKQSSFAQMEDILDERMAAVVARHLASSRALTKNFKMYLQKLIIVSNEPAVHVRTRAMKALSSIVAADPGILSDPDMQQAVEYRFRDTSTLVREAAVDLIGRFVLSRPELTLKYYDMIAERIRDSGVSVRKRVIKILKDICVMQPDFPKINDICVRIIKRISDEEVIKQLVSSVFSELWFTPLPDGSDQKELLLRRVTNITAVVGICKEYEWFEQLLEQILKNEDQAATRAVLNVCQMMVDCLVENVLSLDENSAKSSSSTSSLMSCIITLYLFCNVKPALLLNHATTLHPYLSATCAVNKDVMVLHFVSKILKEVVPLMEHPSRAFLASLEEDLIKLIMKHGQLLIHSCVECLGAVVNNVTHNYNLVKDCFQRFFKCLEQMRTLQTQNPTHPQLKTHRASLLRSLFTVGVLCKFFNFNKIIPQSTGGSSTSAQVYSHLIYFFKNGDAEIQVKTVKGLGLFCIRYPEMMLDSEMRSLINDWLTKDCASTKKIEVLRNLHNYLKEVELQLKEADTKWEAEGADKETLLEFGDQQSSVSSNIAQAFLQPILESYCHTELQVRFGAMQAVLLILRQGLVHPAQCVPYLVAMSTDPDQTIKVKADQHLTEHTTRYGHLMQTQLLGGVRKSYEFQKLIAGDGARGYSTDNIGNYSSLLSHIYTLARSNKQHRRVMLKALLRHFEDYEKNPLGLLLYLADTLAYLPYNTLEEPLFVVHHVDMTISIAGSNLLQQFKEILGTKGHSGAGDDDSAHLAEQSCDLQLLSECCHSCQGCFLLLLLKQHLKKSFGLSDSKCQKYSPTESNKANDKATNRKGGVVFDPQQVVEMVKQEAISGGRRLVMPKDDCIRQYMEFKQLMDKLDPFDGDDDGSDQEAPPPAAPPPVPPSAPNTAPPTGPNTAPEPAQPLQHLKVPQSEGPRGSSHGRSSRASSSSSISSRRGKHEKTQGKSKRKKKRIVVSSDSSDDDDHEWT